jgi:hypothetical protein
MANKLPIYPADHKVGTRVPIGGSNCVTCEYLKADGKSCGKKLFTNWNGSEKLPFPANEFCCDFYEPIEGVIRKQVPDKSVKMRAEKYLDGLRGTKE